MRGRLRAEGGRVREWRAPTPRRRGPFGAIVLLLSGAVALAAAAAAQDEYAEGESVFTNATPVDLGSGLTPAYPPAGRRHADGATRGQRS